jgi:hypothetical protein
VRLTRSDRGYGDIEIATVGPRGIFGEMALIDGSPRLKRIDDKTRNLILFLIRYCRDTLLYPERQKSRLLFDETKDDSLARRYLELPLAKNGDVAGEPFVSASIRLLVYAK